MQAKIPVLAVTDPNTDIGKVIVDGGFGWWCESDDAERFSNIITSLTYKEISSELPAKEFQYLNDHYSVIKSYEIIVNSKCEVNYGV